MKLCDQCIQSLKEDLSKESTDILERALPLFAEQTKLSDRDLWKLSHKNRSSFGESLLELELSMLLKGIQDGRRNFFQLTETGQRLKDLYLNDNFEEQKEFEEIEAEDQSLEEEKDIDTQEEIEEVIEESKDSRTKEEESDQESEPIVWNLNL